MRNPALQERRNRQILADIVRTYIETGEPVSSRAISKRFEESLSTATIRSVMADLGGVYGVNFYNYWQDKRFPTSEFDDNHHLNSTGALRFTRYLKSEVIDRELATDSRSPRYINL